MVFLGEDFDMNTLNPMSLLVQTLSMNESFNEGSKKIASFIRRNEERFGASLLADSLLNGTTDPMLREYILFSLLDVSRADFDILQQAVQLRQLRRLIGKATCHPGALNDNEVSVCNKLHRDLHFFSIDHVAHASHIARIWVQRLMNDNDLDEQQRYQLALLLASEIMAFKERIMRLSERVDSYDMHAIAQLLPLLTMCDEQVDALTELGERIGRHEKLGKVVLTFEYAMGTDNFERWMENVGRQPSLREFFELIRLQRTRLVPLQTVVAAATHSRSLHEPDTPPITWLYHALCSCTTGGLRTDTGAGSETDGPIFDSYDPVPSGTSATPASAPNAHLSPIESDMRIRYRDDDVAEPPPNGEVPRHIPDDAQLLRLLGNAKVFETRGIRAKAGRSGGSDDNPRQRHYSGVETVPPRTIRPFRQMTVPVITGAIAAALLIATVTFFIFNIRRAGTHPPGVVSRRQMPAHIQGNRPLGGAAIAAASTTPPAPLENSSLPEAVPATPSRRKSRAAYTLATLEAMVDDGNISTALKHLNAGTINDGAYYSLYARCLYESGEWKKACEAAEMSTRVPSGRITLNRRMGQYLLYRARYLSAQYNAVPSREAAREAIDAWWNVREHFDDTAENAKVAFAESEIIIISKIFRDSRG